MGWKQWTIVKCEKLKKNKIRDFARQNSVIEHEITIVIILTYF